MCIFFTHIPKTAGTSIRKSIFDNNIPQAQKLLYSGMRAAITNSDNFKILQGHYPYGIHKLYKVQAPKYYVMLREPIDRSISYYYFIKRTSESADYTHPHICDVKRNTLVDFYSYPKYQNVQTRIIAGIKWEFIGRYQNLNNLIGNWVIKQAKNNLLRHYEAYGLKERFKDSIKLFATKFGTEYSISHKKFKKTPNRPSTLDLSKEEVKKISDYNSLDMELYDFAKEHFDSQLIF